MEGTDYYQYLRVGIVDAIELGKDAAMVRRPTFGTLTVRWKDRGTTVQDNVPLVSPASGNGWGMYSVPKVGDVILAGFRPGGFPVLLGYLPINLEGQIGLPNATTGEREPKGPGVTFRPIRYMEPGEMVFKSGQGTEIYFDKEGVAHFIVREKSVETDANFGDVISWLKMGKVRQNDKYLLRPTEGPVDQPLMLQGSQVNFDLKHKSGLRIQINEEGAMQFDSLPDNGGFFVNTGLGGLTVNSDKGDIVFNITSDTGVAEINTKQGVNINATADGAEINIVCKKINHNLGTESMVMGATLKEFLSSLIDTIAQLTVPTGVGPSGTPLNATAFNNLKSQYLSNDKILSDKSFLDK
jgi:hypothetical protein